MIGSRGQSPASTYYTLKKIWHGVKRFYVFLIAICSISVFLLYAPSYPVLTVKSKEGQILYSTPLQPREPFYIQYIHSIHLTPVLEKYYVDEELNIVVDAVTYDTYGVGMPSELEEGQTFTQENGKFTLGNINRHLPFFDQRIGQVIANHKLIVRQQEIPLSIIASPGSSIRFQADMETTIQHWIRRFLP